MAKALLVETVVLNYMALHGQQGLFGTQPYFPNHGLGANLAFRLRDQAEVYVLNHARNRQHGRAPQYDLWSRGESALRARTGKALLVYEFTLLREPHRPEWEAHQQSFFESLETLPELRVLRIGKRGPWRHKIFRFLYGELSSG